MTVVTRKSRSRVILMVLGLVFMAAGFVIMIQYLGYTNAAYYNPNAIITVRSGTVSSATSTSESSTSGGGNPATTVNFVLTSTCVAPSALLTGTVLASDTGQALGGASIQIIDTPEDVSNPIILSSTAADSNGAFSLTVPATAKTYVLSAQLSLSGKVYSDSTTFTVSSSCGSTMFANWYSPYASILLIATGIVFLVASRPIVRGPKASLEIGQRIITHGRVI